MSRHSSDSDSESVTSNKTEPTALEPSNSYTRAHRTVDLELLVQTLQIRLAAIRARTTNLEIDLARQSPPPEPTPVVTRQHFFTRTNRDEHHFYRILFISSPQDFKKISGHITKLYNEIYAPFGRITTYSQSRNFIISSTETINVAISEFNRTPSEQLKITASNSDLCIFYAPGATDSLRLSTLAGVLTRRNKKIALLSDQNPIRFLHSSRVESLHKICDQQITEDSVVKFFKDIINLTNKLRQEETTSLFNFRR